MRISSYNASVVCGTTHTQGVVQTYYLCPYAAMRIASYNAIVLCVYAHTPLPAFVVQVYWAPPKTSPPNSPKQYTPQCLGTLISIQLKRRGAQRAIAVFKL